MKEVIKNKHGKLIKWLLEMPFFELQTCWNQVCSITKLNEKVVKNTKKAYKAFLIGDVTEEKLEDTFLNMLYNKEINLDNEYITYENGIFVTMDADTAYSKMFFKMFMVFHTAIMNGDDTNSIFKVYEDYNEREYKEDTSVGRFINNKVCNIYKILDTKGQLKSFIYEHTTLEDRLEVYNGYQRAKNRNKSQILNIKKYYNDTGIDLLKVLTGLSILPNTMYEEYQKGEYVYLNVNEHTLMTEAELIKLLDMYIDCLVVNIMNGDVEAIVSLNCYAFEKGQNENADVQLLYNFETNLPFTKRKIKITDDFASRNHTKHKCSCKEKKKEAFKFVPEKIDVNKCEAEVDEEEKPFTFIPEEIKNNNFESDGEGLTNIKGCLKEIDNIFDAVLKTIDETDDSSITKKYNEALRVQLDEITLLTDMLREGHINLVQVNEILLRTKRELLSTIFKIKKETYGENKNELR